VFHLTIKKRITLSILLFCSAFILIISYIVYNDSSALLADQKKIIMSNQLDRVSENINYLIQLNEKETEKLASNETVHTFLADEISVKATNDYLTGLMSSKENNALYKDFFILNTDGFITATTMKSAENIDLSMRDYFKKSKTNLETVNSNILIARSDEELILITLTPIIKENELKAFAGIAIKAKYFSSFLKNMKIGESGYYIILDQNSRIVSHPDESLIAKSYDNITINESEYIVINKKMNETKYELIAILNQSEINEEQNLLLTNTYIFGFSGVILALILGVFLSNKITKPIEEMNAYIEKVIKSSEIFKEKVNQQKNLFSHENKMNQLKKNTSFVLSEIENTKLFKYTQDMERFYENTLKFVSKLSHDLRTPLTLIKGYSKGLVTDDPRKRKKYLEKIDKSVHDVENIIYNELDIAYELNKDAHINRKKVPLEGYIQQIIEEINAISKEHTREIRITKDKISGFAYLDQTNIKRVIENIINNALKYSNQEISIIFKDSDNNLDIEIKDQGIGMAPSELNKVRDIFYQSQSDHKGYGLGLHIADNIINNHDYHMTIESEPNSGTTVTISIKKINL
jgi:signal transduction histidine kinase